MTFYVFELFIVDNFCKEENDFLSFLSFLIFQMANFNGKRQVDEFQGQESTIDIFTDSCGVMKELSKDTFERHEKTTNQVAAKLK